MLLDSDGPLWYRGWAYGKEETVCEQVERVLAITGTRRMIMGHTANLKASLLIRDRNMSITSLFFQHIVSRCGGKIIIIDTGKKTHSFE
jgi:hypothetical protein